MARSVLDWDMPLTESPPHSCFDRYRTDVGASDYRKKYGRSLIRRLSNFQELRAARRALRAAGGTGPVLDVPCGAGRMTPVILSFYPSVVCADSSRTMLDEVEEVARIGWKARAGFVQASALDLPFPDRSFDVAVCWRLIHHFHDAGARQTILDELARVARRRVVLSFSDADTTKGRRVKRRPVVPGRGQALLTEAEMTQAADRAGLRLLRFFPLSKYFSTVMGALFAVAAAPAET